MARTSNLSLLDLIGNTPLIPIQHISEKVKPVKIFAKAEWLNPGGSVKDRAAREIILDGERSGKLKPGKIILDSSSGNTAIAYAMIGAAKGYAVEMVVPDNLSFERRKILAAFGAKLIFTPAAEGSDGAIRFAQNLSRQHPEKYFFADQYNNPANPRAHFRTTAPEIWKQTGGKITHLVATLGTSGTAMGTGARLKRFNKNIRLIGVQPRDSFHGLEGMKHMPSSILPGIYREDQCDEILMADTDQAYDMVQRLAKEEGVLVGPSSGVAMNAAMEVASRIKRGVVVAIFPDRGDHYLSSRVWETLTPSPLP